MGANWSKMPTVGTAGDLLPFMSARRRHDIVDWAFEELGGVERLVHEANRDRDSFWEFMKLWGKGLPKIAAGAEFHQHNHSIESMLDKLDAAEKSGQIVDAEFEEVPNAPAKEPVETGV